MAAVFRTKVGDSFSLNCARTDSSGDPFPLSGLTISSDMQRNSEVITLSVDVSDEAGGLFSLSLTNTETANLEPGIYEGDIQFSEVGAVASTDDFCVVVEKDVTGAS